jgi:phosphoribosylformylglycinamidine synthase
VTEGQLTTQTYLVEVFISLKPAVNDPAGLAIRDGLHTLGFAGVERVRTGKYLQLSVAATSADEAERSVSAMCDTLLANTVIEQYRVAVAEAVAS